MYLILDIPDLLSYFLFRRSIIRRGILDLYLDSQISAECEAYFSKWTKRPKYNFLFDIFRWFWIDDEAERNFMALIRYHKDKEQLEKTRRNIFKKRRSSDQYSRNFISCMNDFVDSKDRWSFVEHGLFGKLVHRIDETNRLFLSGKVRVLRK